MWIFFPPRLIKMKDDVLDSYEKVEHALDEYTDESLPLISNENDMKDAQKIIEFSRGFPGINDSSTIRL